MARPRNAVAGAGASSGSGPGPGSAEVVNNKYEGMNPEPSCEELKAMWRFSKRQSRAAEITNEIPTYRDPFSYNVWEPYYARSRSMGGLRMGTRFRNRPVYGVVHKVPPFRVQDVVERNRAFEEVARLYGTVQRGETPRRRITAFRLSGGAHVPHMGLAPQTGSFQHLKELIRTERARELQEQRMAEEVAARAATLKDISTGNHDRHRQQNMRDSYAFNEMDASPRDKQLDRLNSARGASGVLAFPDLLAPAARADAADEYVQEYQRSALSPHRSLYGDSAFNVNAGGVARPDSAWSFTQDQLDSELVL